MVNAAAAEALLREHEPVAGRLAADHVRDGIRVNCVCPGSTDTDMMAGWDVPKNDPADVVRATYDGVEEVVVNEDCILRKGDPLLIYGDRKEGSASAS